MRVDFNLPLIKGKIQDDFRIKKVVPFIKELSGKGLRIILLSHFKPGDKYLSLKKVADFIKKKYLKNLIFLPDLFGEQAKRKINSLKPGEIVLLENVRKYAGEEENSRIFAKNLARLADVYINEAFSVSHRGHASIIGVPKYLPSDFGQLFSQEIKNLKQSFHPQHPFLLVLAGKKIETKLPLIEKFIGKADFIAVAGKLIAELIFAKNKKIDRLIMPTDLIVLRNGTKALIKTAEMNKNDVIADIGPESLKNILKLAKLSKFILWNGPLGWLEKGFYQTTKKLALDLAGQRKKKRIIIGGGDTVGYLSKFGLLDKFSFVSTGGGAMLSYLARGTLPGIEAVKRGLKIKKI